MTTRAQAVLLELESFSKLTYQNLNQNLLKSNGYPKLMEAPNSESSQAQGITFVPNQSKANYQTPQVALAFECPSQHLHLLSRRIN